MPLSNTALSKWALSSGVSRRIHPITVLASHTYTKRIIFRFFATRNMHWKQLTHHMTLERILLPFFTENPKLEQECCLIFFRGSTGSPNTFNFNPGKDKNWSTRNEPKYELGTKAVHVSLAIVVIKPHARGPLKLRRTLGDAAQNGRGAPSSQSRCGCPGPLGPWPYPRPSSSPAQGSQTPWP